MPLRSGPRRTVAGQCRFGKSSQLFTLDKNSDWDRGQPGGFVITTITSLPELLKAFVDAQLANKGFGNVSEYFRSLLREAQAKEEDARLEGLLLEGLASGRVPLDAQFRERLEAKVEQVIDKHKDRPRP